MLLCIVFVAAAPSASALEETISPGIDIGIGQVKLGMTTAQVKKRLGADYLQSLFSLTMVFGGVPKRIVDYTVVEVRVRSPFEPLDEFGAKRQYRCSDDWRTTDSPEKVAA